MLKTMENAHALLERGRKNLLKLIGKECNLIAGVLCNKIQYPKNKVADTGKQANKTNYQCNNILGFEVTKDAINTANYAT